MDLPIGFICSGFEYNTLEKHVAAPYFRRTFHADIQTKAHVLIGACGFYQLYINGVNVSKGPLAPYISNPDDIVYYDSYDVELVYGQNTIGVWLGNGFQNNPGGYIWDFDKSSFRSSPKFAMSVTWRSAEGRPETIESDSMFLTAPSPITFDDYRFGEHYDARLEQNDWMQAGFDDSSWAHAVEASVPGGQRRLCGAEPIAVTRQLKAVSVTAVNDGYIYDFKENCAGVCRLDIDGRSGQRICMQYGEWIRDDGTLDIEHIWFRRDEKLWTRDKDLVHRDVYTCRDGVQTYTPRFTYHGFRYVYVTGITARQAKPELLTYLVMNSDLERRGGFVCSDETVNRLYECTIRSDLANFYYFPTDCPHREKNGWTADAALSAEQMIMNLGVENSYREWLRNICCAQAENGSLPGIIPTGGWGFSWGNGPAWDCVLAYLPYYVYIYRGETEMIKESADALTEYLRYLLTRTNPDGLLKIGLGDWCPVDRKSSAYVAPLEFTDTVMAYDIAKKAEFMFDAVGLTDQRDFAGSTAARFKAAVRARLVDTVTFTAAGNCQTSQAMAIFYDIFEPDEKNAAFEKLIELIYQNNCHFDVGVLGARVLFHVLAEFSCTELALKMITGPEFPSYGSWIKSGATSLWENFSSSGAVQSRNHHFWGDIAGWFIRYLAGIYVNPSRSDANSADISPYFAQSLDYAEGFHILPAGKVSSEWKRCSQGIRLTVHAPGSVSGNIRLQDGYTFSDGQKTKPLRSAVYNVIKSK